jgi:hypothetical protein
MMVTHQHSFKTLQNLSLCYHVHILFMIYDFVQQTERHCITTYLEYVSLFTEEGSGIIGGC